MLHYQLALLRQYGVTDIILSCSYRVEDVRAAMGTGAEAGVSLRYVVEAEPLGTAGGVRNAADLARGRLIVLNGDILTDADLGAALRFHEERDARATICLIPVEDPSQYGLVETDEAGAVRHFLEKPTPAQLARGAGGPPPHRINAGIYILEADLLRRIPAERPTSIEREFFPALLADGVPTFGFPLAGYWRDIGSPAAYREAQLDLLRGRVATTLSPAGARRDGCWVGADARLPRGVTLEPPTVIGAGVRAQAGAHLGPLAVIGDHSRIAAGARVEGAILWERVRVGVGTTLRDCIVGTEAVIGAHVTVTAGVVLEAGAIVPDHAQLLP
jgi:NDP-sugar pyrophosphorylase family protein